MIIYLTFMCFLPVIFEIYIYLSGLHTNYSLMEELIACKKAVGKVVRGAPNVSSTVCRLKYLISIEVFQCIL